MQISVVGRADAQVLVVDALQAAAVGVDHRWVGIEFHAALQAVVIHRGDVLAIWRVAHFGLNDRSQRHQLRAGPAQRVESRLPLRAPVREEAVGHHSYHLPSGGMNAHEVGGGIEESFRRRRAGPEP